MERQEMIDAMEWLAPDSGTGFGICRVGNIMAWALAKPNENQPDLKSVVAIRGDPDLYTDIELEVLYGFSQRQTAAYDEMFRWRLSANLIIIGKDVWGDDVKWLRKRLSWDMGSFYSETLEEAMAIFEKRSHD